MAHDGDNTAWKKASARSPALTMLLPALLVGFMGIGWGLPGGAHRLYFTTPESLDSAVRTVGEHRRETEAASSEGRPAPEKLPRSAYNALRSYHPDEYYVFKMLSGIRPGRLRFDPKWYVIGGAYLYPLGAWLQGAEAVGLATLDPRPEFYLERPDEMTDLYLVGRTLTVLMGATAVIVIAHAAWRLFGLWASLFCGLLVTLSPLYAMHSSFMYNDVPGLLWVSLCILFTISLVEKGRRRDYILCGLVAGLAAGTKLFDGLVFALPVAAHFLRAKTERRLRPLALAFVVAAVTFFVTNPYYVLKLPEVAANFRAHLRPGSSFAFYLRSAGYGFGVLPVLLVVVAWVVAVVKRHRLIILIGLWTAGYYVLVSLFAKQFARYLLPIFPAMALMCAYLLQEATKAGQKPDKSRQEPDRTRQKPTRSWRALVGVLCVLIVFPQLLTTGEIVRDVSRKDSRTVAGEWVLKHLKGGEEIAVTEEPWQFEMPPMDRKRYRIAVCGYDAGALLRGGAKVFVYSDLQSDPGVNPHRDVLGEAEFWNELKQGSVAEVFELAFVAPVPRDVRKYYSALGLWKAQPEDLRYVSPRVVVLRRKGKGRAGAPD